MVPRLPKDIPTLSYILNQSQQRRWVEQDMIKLNSKTTRKNSKLEYNHKDEGQPWKASYNTSAKTQERLLKASKLKDSPINRAINVLSTFMKTPLSYCNPVNIVYALTLTAKIVEGQNEEFRELLHATLNKLHHLLKSNELNTRQLANSLWAIAKHYSVDHSILPPNFNNYISSSEKWIVDEVDNKYAREKQVLVILEEISHQLIQVFYDSNPKSMKPMNAIESSMTCWAIATLYPRQIPAGWAIPPRNSQMISNNAFSSNANGFITFEMKGFGNDEELVLLPSFPHNLFRAISFYYDRRLKNEGTTCLRDFRMKEIATIIWSYATSGIRSSESNEDSYNFISKLTEETIRRLREINSVDKCLPRDFTEIAWSLGVIQNDNYLLSDNLDAFVKEILNYQMSKEDNLLMLKDWKSADCVQMAICLAHGRLDEQNLLTAIYTKALKSLLSTSSQSEYDHSFQSWELIVLLWVQARMYLKDLGNSIFDNFLQEVPKHLLSCNLPLGPQEQANVAWALTVLEQYDDESSKLLKRIFGSFSSTALKGTSIQVEHAHQIWQSYCILKDSCPSAVADVDSEVFRFLKNTWKKEKKRNKSSSARHKALSDTLNLMGVRHLNEHIEDIDVAIVLKLDSKWTIDSQQDMKNFKAMNHVAVEFDGPTHFTKIKPSVDGKKPDPPRALGHTVLKYRLLKKQGWTIVRIPFYEFDKIPFWASMERQRYLQRRLKTHANIKFSDVDVSEYKVPSPNKKSRYD